MKQTHSFGKSLTRVQLKSINGGYGESGGGCVVSCGNGLPCSSFVCTTDCMSGGEGYLTCGGIAWECSAGLCWHKS